MQISSEYANAYDVVLGYSGEFLGNNLSDWWRETYEQSGSIAFPQFTGSANLAPGQGLTGPAAAQDIAAQAKRPPTLQLTPKTAGAATINLQILGTFTGTGGAGSVTFPRTSPLVVSIPVVLYLNQSSGPAQNSAEANNLTTVFGSASWQQTLSFQVLQPQIQGGSIAVSSDALPQNNAALLAQMQSGFAAWLKAKLLPSIQLRMLALKGGTGGSVLAPQRYWVGCLGAGTTTGQVAAPESLIIVGWLPGRQSGSSGTTLVPYMAINDSGALFSVNQQTSQGVVPSKVVPVAMMAISPMVFANWWGNVLATSQNYAQAMTNSVAVVADSGDLWTVQTATIADPGVTIVNPVQNAGTVLDCNASNATSQTGVISDASLSDSVQYLMNWVLSPSAASVQLTVNRTVTGSCTKETLFLGGPTTISAGWSMTFPMIGQANGAGVAFTPMSRNGSFGNYSDFPAPGPGNCSLDAVDGLENALIQFRPTMEGALNDMQGSVGVTLIADVSSTASAPLLDTQYCVNMTLTAL